MTAQEFGKYLRHHVAVVLGCIALGLLWAFIGFYPSRTFDTPEQSGQFGDSFGFATSLFSSFAFIAGMAALIMQIKESQDAGKRDEELQKMKRRQLKLAYHTIKLQQELQDGATSQIVLKCIVSLNHNLSRLRSAWIDSSVYSPSFSADVRRQFDTAIEALTEDRITIATLFKTTGERIADLTAQVIDITQGSFGNATHNGHRTSDLTLWFDMNSDEIQELTSTIWNSQPGIAAFHGASGAPVAELSTLIALNKILIEAMRIRSDLRRLVNSFHYEQQQVENATSDFPVNSLKFILEFANASMTGTMQGVTDCDPKDKEDLDEALRSWMGLVETLFGEGDPELGPEFTSYTKIDQCYDSTIAAVMSISKFGTRRPTRNRADLK